MNAGKNNLDLSEIINYIKRRKSFFQEPSMAYYNRYACAETESREYEIKDLCQFLGIDYEAL